MVVRKANKNRGKSVVRYPWDRWFGEDKFVLRKGREYTCAIHGMAAMVRNVASQRGIRVSLSITDAGVITVLVLGKLKGGK